MAISSGPKASSSSWLTPFGLTSWSFGTTFYDPCVVHLGETHACWEQRLHSAGVDSSGSSTTSTPKCSKNLDISTRKTLSFCILSCWWKASKFSALNQEKNNTLGMVICLQVIVMRNTWLLSSWPSNQASSLPWFSAIGEVGVGGVEISLSDCTFLWQRGIMCYGLALTNKYECKSMMPITIFIESAH